jgi:hypothetical protein
MMLRLGLVLLGLLPAGIGLLGAWWLGRRAGGRPHLTLTAGLAALAVVLLVALLRGLELLVPGASLPAWFATSGPTTPAALSLLLLKLALLQGSLFAGLMVALSQTQLAQPQQQTRTGPLLPSLGVLVLLLSVLGLLTAPQPFEPVIDWAALGPLLGLALLAVGLGQAEASKATSTSERSDPAVPAKVTGKADPEATLRQAGLLQAAPDLIFPAKSPASATSSDTDPAASSLTPAALHTLWQGCGGAGSPPTVLPKLLAGLGPTFQATRGRWLGDLPPDSLDLLTDCLLTSALWGLGGRVLVVSPQPEAVLARLTQVQERLGLSRPGACVVGSGALKEQLTAGLFPALVILDVHELFGESLRHLSRLNPHWLAQLDQVLLLRVDGLLPIGSTHLALSLRRLALLAGSKLGEGRRLHWLALSEGGPAGRSYLEQAVGRSFDELSLGAIETTAARVYLRRRSPDKESGSSELATWAKRLREAGVTVALEDTVGELGPLGPSLVGDAAHLHPTIGYHGAASLALGDERNLAQLYRTGGQLLRRQSVATALSVVWFKAGPLTRFLSQPGVLAGLATRGELKTPRPLAGTDNLFVAAAHLEAALDEGEPDEAELRQAFSDAVVDDLLKARTDVQRVGLRARWHKESRRVTRSVRLSRPGAPLSEQRRQTITPNVLPVQSRHDGVLLGRVDRRLAPTRYYPHRIFAHHGQLFAVLSAVTQSTTAIQVGPAPVGSQPTLPLLALHVESTGYHGTIERHHFGPLTFARAVAGITVTEAVTGVLLRGAAEPSVRYPAVEARYDSLAVVILFERVPSAAALFHLARVVDLILQAHLVIEDEDVEVLALEGGLGEVTRPSLVLVDRHLGGLGLAAAVDAAMAHNLLRWAWGVLYSCPCMNGCEQCTPKVVLQRGADKQGVLKLLGG